MVQEEWLDMELFLRMTSSHAPLFENVLFPSLLIFWPRQHLRLIVVLDAENPDDAAWIPKLERQFLDSGMASFKIFLEEPSDVYEGAKKPGHNRMQWGMFWPDNYVSAEYVGFIDTDTLFTTIVHPGALYKDGRPIVFGAVGLPLDAMGFPWWKGIGETTAYLLRRPEIMRAMNYFPVIIKVSHIVEMRSFITKRTGEKNFDAAFKTFTVGFDGEGDKFSQFNIMANYVFYRKFCDYLFAFQEYKPGFRDPIAGQTACLDYILNERNTMPRVRVAIHWGYLSDTSPEHRGKIVREGYCRSGGTTKPARCEEWPELDRPGVALQKSLFQFEYHDWTWNPLCRRAQMHHYSEAANFPHSWPDNVEELLTLAASGQHVIV